MEGCDGKLGSEEGIKEEPNPTIKPDLYWQQFKTSCCASLILPKPSKKWEILIQQLLYLDKDVPGNFGEHWALLL